jgi:hypothetical protein
MSLSTSEAQFNKCRTVGHLIAKRAHWKTLV